MVDHAPDMIGDIILANVDNLTDEVSTGLSLVVGHLIVVNHAFISLMLFPGLFIFLHDCHQLLLDLLKIGDVPKSQLQELALLP